MATKTDPKPAGVADSDIKQAGKTYEGLSRQQLTEAYRIMYTSRRLDDREIMLKRQQKIFFQISGAGHEAIGVAAAFALKTGYDWFYPYYRDRALCLGLGVSPYDMLLQAVVAADDPSSGGRQMPSHWSFPRLHIVTGSSPTGTQILQSVGCAEVARYLTAHPNAAKKVEGDYRQFKDVEFHGDEITYVSLGDGTTSEGEFWEAMNTASNLKLPLMFVVEDNEYAISVPVEVQTAGGSISRLVTGFPDFHFEEVDGTDPVASYAAFTRSVKHCRAGRGPAFIHAHVIRPYSHSLSDDERLYRPDVERQRDAARDPITRMQMFLLREGILDETGINKLEKQVDDDLQAAIDRALHSAPPVPETVTRFVYSPDLDPTSSAFETQPAPAKAEPTPTDGKKLAAKTMADLINATLRDEMPLIRWRSNNGFSAPCVIRVAIGGYLTGGAIYHSQCGESIFTHIPGLRVVFPSNALDAAGLLRTAIRCDDPVLFLEHKRLYRETYGRASYPGPDYMIPFGKAKIVQPGTDMTVITYGAVVPRALQAAQKLEREDGIKVELIDLRTLNPYDWETIAASVAKTNRVLVAYEDTMSWGYGAEIAARIADQLFQHLDAPVRRVAALDTFVAYQPILEDAILPQANDLYRGMKQLAEF